MAAKKTTKRSTKSRKKVAARKPARKKTKAATRRRVAKSPLRRTAVKVLAGAAAGAVRAIIPPLEEVAGASEKIAGTPEDAEREDGNANR